MENLLLSLPRNSDILVTKDFFFLNWFDYQDKSLSTF